MTSPRTLGAILHEDFELLDLYGPSEMFGSLGADARIVTVAEQVVVLTEYEWQNDPSRDLFARYLNRAAEFQLALSGSAGS